MIYRQNSRQSGRGFDLDGAESKIADFELEMQSPDFWKDHRRAGEVSKELMDLKEQVEFWRSLENQLNDPAVDVQKLKKEFDKQYTKIFLSGKYDRGDALLSVRPGAGGEDAEDWAHMLMDMYRKYSERTGWEFMLLDTFTAEISGKFAFGYLKGESGVHRLVRVSPFDSNARRHTSFALVEMLPHISEEESEIKINPSDLRVDTYR